MRLSLDMAVPVRLESDHGVQRGLARNISETGILVELADPPPIGTEVRIFIAGIEGSRDAPDALIIRGEVRHHLAWQFTRETKRRTLRGIGVRFLDDIEEVGRAPLTSWIWNTGGTVH